eukprot:5656261-Pyramimonas_sp.AAC.1
MVGPFAQIVHDLAPQRSGPGVLLDEIDIRAKDPAARIARQACSAFDLAPRDLVPNSIARQARRRTGPRKV